MLGSFLMLIGRWSNYCQTDIKAIYKDTRERPQGGYMYKYLLNIHAFDGDGAAASASGEASGDAASAQVGNNGSANNGTNTASNETAESTFDDYVKAHKDEANEWFQKQFKRRHKDYKQLQERSKAADTVLNMLATKYGFEDARDINAITEALQRDDFLYAQRAEENGRSIDEQREWDELERQNREYRAERARQEQQENMQKQVDKWYAESENLKQLFPSFDLEADLQNPEFTNMLRNGNSVQSAFYAIHGEEIAAGAMEYTASKVRQAAAQDFASRGKRPLEASIRGQASAKSVGKDFSNMSLRELRAYART